MSAERAAGAKPRDTTAVSGLDARPAAAVGPRKLAPRHPWLEPRIAIPVAIALAAVQLPFLHAALRGAAPIVAAVPYKDAFERATLGDAWWSNGGLWRIVDGQL